MTYAVGCPSSYVAVGENDVRQLLWPLYGSILSSRGLGPPFRRYGTPPLPHNISLFWCYMLAMAAALFAWKRVYGHKSLLRLLLACSATTTCKRPSVKGPLETACLFACSFGGCFVRSSINSRSFSSGYIERTYQDISASALMYKPLYPMKRKHLPSSVVF